MLAGLQNPRAEYSMSYKEIADLEHQIYDLTRRLHVLRRNTELQPIPNYSLRTADGKTTLLDLFGDQDRMLVIHNMGQGCRYCTLWADGINGLLAHLESAMSVVLVSQDTPDVQRRFAGSRGWRFRLASHSGSNYMQEQNVSDEGENYPGAVVYEKQNGAVFRRAKCIFGPGDLYCSMWNLLALAGFGDKDWFPQFHYWKRPEVLDDGGEGLQD